MLEMVYSLDYVAIVLDLMLPGSNGFEVAQVRKILLGQRCNGKNRRDLKYPVKI
jgi:hypothetical protein